MSENAFRKLGTSVDAFIETIDHPRKKAEAYQLVTLFEEVTGQPAELWSHGIIGFGDYHYHYRSGTNGDIALLAFAPRKTRHSIYIMPDFPNKEELLAQLGKYKLGKGCLYVNKLPDIDLAVLRQILTASLETLTKKQAEA